MPSRDHHPQTPPDTPRHPSLATASKRQRDRIIIKFKRKRDVVHAQINTLSQISYSFQEGLHNTKVAFFAVIQFRVLHSVFHTFQSSIELSAQKALSNLNTDLAKNE